MICLNTNTDGNLVITQLMFLLVCALSGVIYTDKV